MDTENWILTALLKSLCKRAKTFLSNVQNWWNLFFSKKRIFPQSFPRNTQIADLTVPPERCDRRPKTFRSWSESDGKTKSFIEKLLLEKILWARRMGIWQSGRNTFDSCRIFFCSITNAIILWNFFKKNYPLKMFIWTSSMQNWSFSDKHWKIFAQDPILRKNKMCSNSFCPSKRSYGREDCSFDNRTQSVLTRSKQQKGHVFCLNSKIKELKLSKRLFILKNP